MMKKVLIIEDAGADRRMFRRLLEKRDDIEDFIFAWDAEKESIPIDIERKEVSINYEMYLFSWDSVPGSDNEKLIKFLEDDFDIDWAKDSEISKSEDRIISISKDENSAEIMIDDEEEKATLKMSDVRTCDLKVKNEDGKLNIYKELIEKKISKYDIIFIDLAWTKDDEDEIVDFRKRDYREILEKKEKYIKSINGFALLNSLNEKKDENTKEKIKKIVTTSFYCDDLAKFCEDELGVKKIFHKWSDEYKIDRFLSEQ